MISTALLTSAICKTCLAGLTGKFVYDCYTGFGESKNAENKIVGAKELKKFCDPTGFILSEEVQLSSKYSKHHVAVVGPTSSGKTSRIVKYNVQYNDSASLICTDPSCDILAETCRPDARIYIFNPHDISKSEGFDPLSLCRDEMAVRSCMEIILLNGFKTDSGTQVSSDVEKWVKISAPILEIFAIYNYRHKKYTFSEMVIRLTSAPLLQEEMQRYMKQVLIGVKKGTNEPIYEERLDCKIVRVENSIEEEIRKSGDVDLIEELDAFMATTKHQEMTSSIQTTLNSALSIFKDKKVQALCKKKPLDITKFRKEKSILFIQIPERYASRYQAITSIYMQQLFDTLQDNPKGLDVFFVFDELCNIGYIPDFDKLLSTIRRYNMGILGLMQSITQLAKIYGDYQAKTILENFNTVCALAGLKESNSYFAEKVGVDTSDKISSSVMSSDSVRRLAEDELLIICKNKRGVVDKLLPFFEPISL